VFIPRAHLVFVTSYRVFAARHLDCIQQIMRDVRADFGTELAEFNGEPEHVPLLVNVPPTVAISRLVRSLNGVSSRRLWSGSYFAGSVGGALISVLRQYTEQQDPPA